MENVNVLENETPVEEEAIGSVQISDDVVAMIAGLAVSEAEGASFPAAAAGSEAVGKGAVRKMMKNVKF